MCHIRPDHHDSVHESAWQGGKREVRVGKRAGEGAEGWEVRVGKRTGDVE